MLTSRQPTMDLKTKDGERPASALPLINVGGARTITGLSEDGLDDELGQRRIRWAWNIALNPDAEQMKREIRFLDQSLWCWRFPDRFTQPEKLEAVLKVLLPQNSWITGSILSTDFSRLLVCSGSHVTNLIEGKQVTLDPRKSKTTSSHPNAARLLTLASVVAFFTDRQIT